MSPGRRRSATAAPLLRALPARLTTREFLRRVQEETVPRLDRTLGSPTGRIVFSSLQLHFGEARLHYEVWPVRKTGRIEIGLHIEGDQAWSREVAAQLAARADALRHGLGPDYELEDWTASWSRLHTTVPLETLTDPVAADIAARLVDLVGAVQPLLRSLDLRPAPPTDSGHASGRERGRHWRRARRRASA